MVALNGHLILIAGSGGKYRYADDPSKVWILLQEADNWRDDIIPPLLGQRMWQACSVVRLENRVGDIS